MDHDQLEMNRDEWVHVRLNQEEFYAFRRVSEEEGISRSIMIRQLIRERIGAGPRLSQNNLDQFGRAMIELSAVGRNLNQMVKLMHQGGLPLLEALIPLLQDLLAHVKALQTEIRNLVTQDESRSVKP